MQNWNRKRYLDVRIDGAADNIGCLIPIKDRADDLELKIQVRAPRSGKRVLDQGLGDFSHVAVNIFERQIEAAVEQDLLDRGAKTAFGGVIHVVRRFIRIDEFGRHRAAHEDVIVAEIIAVEQQAENRVVKGFRQLGLQVIADQLHVLAFNRKP